MEHNVRPGGGRDCRCDGRCHCGHAVHEVGWGNFADAAYEDLKWKFEMGFAIEKGLWQGGLNILNGLTDSAITYANVAIEQKLNPSDPFAIARAVFDPIIPHYDWSKGLVVDEDPLAHEVSKILGASGVEILAGFGIERLVSSASRAALPARVFEKGFIDKFVDGTVSAEELARLREVAKHFRNLDDIPLEILTERPSSGFSRRLHQILLEADETSIPKGTLAEEVQHAIDSAAGLFDDGRLAKGLPKIKARFGEY